MATAEAVLVKPKCPKLEITKQDFFQEAKTIIALHHERISENKVQGTSVDVFKNKQQKPKSGKYIPMEFKNTGTPDIIQKHQRVLRNICFPKKLSKNEHFKEPLPQRICFKEPHIFSTKIKYPSIGFFTKEQVKLGKIMTDIESVSKNMEKEKHQHPGKSRLLESSYTLPPYSGLPLQPMTSSSGLQREPDRALYDWRGVVSTRSYHLPQDSRQSFSGSSVIFLEFCMKTLKKRRLQPIKLESKPQARRKKIIGKGDKLDDKVKRIGPHIEIFQVFRERSKLKITKKTVKAIITLQAHVRGWLERRRFQRIKTKALYHGPNLKAVLNMYQVQIHHVRHRLGLWRTRQVINFVELEEWMDRKKFYETMFAKREDWQGLERSELLKYFNDCGHFPTQQQVDDFGELFHRDRKRIHSEVIKKSNAIEMLFTMYPPQGAHVHSCNSQLKSTWLRPIVNGEEGYKYIVSEHPILKRANIRIVGKLVAKSIRERKMRQY